jgi:hypothetical protein
MCPLCAHPLGSSKASCCPPPGKMAGYGSPSLLVSFDPDFAITNRQVLSNAVLVHVEYEPGK